MNPFFAEPCRPLARRTAHALLMVASIILAIPPAGAIEVKPRDVAGPNGSHGARQLIAAVKTGDADTIRSLVRAGIDIDARVSGDGTALTTAARAGDLALVNLLLHLGADVNQATRGDGNPLIMAASRKGNLEVVKRLVRAGAHVNAIVVDDETPLINASRSGDLGIVKFLVSHGARVDLAVPVRSRDHVLVWRTPLNQARTVEIKSFLLAHGAD